MSAIRKKLLFQVLYAVSQLVFPLVTYPYITRAIGAQGLGLVGYVEYVSGFIITIVAFGIPFYGVREAAKLQNQPQQLRILFRQLFSIHLLLSCLGLFVFIGLIALSGQEIALPLLILGCMNILLPAFVAEWYMYGIEAFQFTTIRSIVLRSLGLIAILLFVSDTEDYLYYYLIVILVQVAVAITNLYKIGFGNVGIRLSGARQHLKGLSYFFLTASAISIYVFFDVIILGWFTDEITVGYYTFGIKVVKLSLLIVLSLNVILFPRISNLNASGDTERIRSLVQKAMSFIIFLSLPIAIGFYFLAPEIVFLLAGREFAPSIILIQILGLLPFIIGMSNLFVYQILIPFGQEKKLLRAVIITCLFSIVIHLFLIQLYKEKGTAFATLLTELTMTFLVYYFSIKTFTFSFPVTVLFQTIVALVPLAIFAVICERSLNNSLAIIGFSTIPGMSLYLLLQLFIFKNPVAVEGLTSLGFGKKQSAING